ncbi:lymphocyte antigen 6K isoform X2 [Phacochoerus africanus]|uniref:lymphocyte antigen 6K isoform X2 n=1 Tax=Phacochoerus africanus TaxID=41426 RepID=UPI001FD8C3A8|nr:lymphocyte antigen 6K isoform X2 [Phacochoerus africanus]
MRLDCKCTNLQLSVSFLETVPEVPARVGNDRTTLQQEDTLSTAQRSIEGACANTLSHTRAMSPGQAAPEMKALLALFLVVGLPRAETNVTVSGRQNAAMRCYVCETENNFLCTQESNCTQGSRFCTTVAECFRGSTWFPSSAWRPVPSRACSSAGPSPSCSSSPRLSCTWCAARSGCATPTTRSSKKTRRISTRRWQGPATGWAAARG